MGRRITRKQLKKEDEFVSTMDTVVRWLFDNWRPLVAGVVAVCVVGLVWWGARSWMGSRADEASLLLRQALITFEGEPAAGSLEPAGDIEAAEAEFQQVVDNYGRTEQADMAKLYLARIALSRGEYDEARATLVDLTQRHDDDVIGRLATHDLINLRLASGQGAEVAGELEAMVTGQSKGLPRDAALFELGELFIREGDSDRAQEYFQKLVDEFPESPYLSSARRRLGEIG
jgi:predicted negative regulator of RcsB-dependent stress response